MYTFWASDIVAVVVLNIYMFIAGVIAILFRELIPKGKTLKQKK